MYVCFCIYGVHKYLAGLVWVSFFSLLFLFKTYVNSHVFDYFSVYDIKNSTLTQIEEFTNVSYTILFVAYVYV